MRIRRIRSRAESLFASARRRAPLLDHGVRAWEHTNASSGFQLAAGVTYYAFLSFFPLIALVYALVGFAVDYVPAAREAVPGALASVLPGLIGRGPGQLAVGQMADAKAGVGVVGLLGLLYAGLGWISSLRQALEVVFGGVVCGGETFGGETFGGEKGPRRGFVRGKLADLEGLALVGAGLLVGIGFGTLLTGYAGGLAAAAGFPGAHLLVVALTELVVLLSMTATFYGTFRLLPGSAPAARGLLEGALLAAFGFEVLRLLATVIVRQFTANPLYGAFAVMVALLVWINYTARLIVFGAAWAATTPGSAPDTEEAGTGPAPDTEGAVAGTAPGGGSR